MYKKENRQTARPATYGHQTPILKHAIARSTAACTETDGQELNAFLRTALVGST
jgi:hypothetical protein